MSLFLQEPDIYYTPNIILSTYLRNYWATSHPLFCTESLESGVHLHVKHLSAGTQHLGSANGHPWGVAALGDRVKPAHLAVDGDGWQP